MSRNLGLTLRDEGGASEDLALIDLLDPENPREYSYGELNRLADVAANFVRESGIKQGESVGVLGVNSAHFVAALLGIMRAGSVAVPINFKFPNETIEFICVDAKLSLTFCDSDQVPRVTAGIPSVNLAAEAFTSFPQPQGRGHPSFEPADGDPGLVLYTSGSTGRPKGVLLSHASQWSIVDRLAGQASGLSGIVAAPLYHMNGLLFLFLLLDMRGTVVLMQRFDAAVYLRVVARYHVNLVSGVPTMLSLMARERELIADLDLSSVVSVQVGSAPLSETVVGQTQLMFPNARISNGYGTTEAGAGMFGAHPDGIPVPAMALGYPADHVGVRLCGGNAEDEGVLEVKTPAAMSGYLNLSQKTAEKLSEDGWINTGDIMRRDAQGFYYFVGRDDDMFVCSGENIYPGEVERLLESDPRIAEACVVPLADELRGQIPVAFVVRSLDAEIDPEQVKQVALAGAPPYMHARHVAFVDEMPLAGTNKIDRRVLAARATEIA